MESIEPEYDRPHVPTRPSFWREFLLLDKPLTWPPKPLRRFPEIRHMDGDDPFARKWLRMWSRGYWIEFAFRCACGMLALTIWLCILVFGTWFGLPLARKLLSGAPRIVAPFAFMLWIIGAVVISVVVGRLAFAVIFRMFPLVRALRWFRLRCELRRRGIPVCIACGYEGGDIAAPKCPECGLPHSPT